MSLSLDRVLLLLLGMVISGAGAYIALGLRQAKMVGMLEQFFKNYAEEKEANKRLRDKAVQMDMEQKKLRYDVDNAFSRIRTLEGHPMNGGAP